MSKDSLESSFEYTWKSPVYRCFIPRLKVTGCSILEKVLKYGHCGHSTGGGGNNKKSFPIFIRFNYKIRLFFSTI